MRILNCSFIFICLLHYAYPQSEPEYIAKKICERVSREAQFELEEAPEPFRQHGIYVFDFPDMKKEKLTAKTNIYFNERTQQNPFFEQPFLNISFDPGIIQIHLNGKELLQKQHSENLKFKLKDYGTASYQYSLPVDLSGVNNLEITYTPQLKKGRIFLGITNKYGINLKGVKLKTNEGDDYVFKKTSHDTWRTPSRNLIYAHESPLDINDWRYFTGILLDAMDQLPVVFSSLDYSDYVNENLDFFSSTIPMIEKERKEKGNISSVFEHYFRYELLDDFGMQTVPCLKRIEGGTASEFEKELVQRALNRILEGETRLDDGTYARINPDSLTVWADDLFMGNVLLIRASKIFNEKSYLKEAVKQTVRIDKHLRDNKSGLYWHGYFDNLKENSSSKWARANGWVMMANTELLLHMDQDHPEYEQVLGIYQSHANAIRIRQSSEGRWHQVLDNQDTYLETSATAMFVRAFSEGIMSGWLSQEDFLPVVYRAWSALTDQVDEDGNVDDIVKGTPILFSDQEYQDQPKRANDPRGLGAMLYACMAMERLQNWSQK